MMRVAAIAAAFCMALVALGCERSKTEAEHRQVGAEDFDRHECQACGMIVSEQSVPRGQLVHRDGTRHYFCSVSDMLTYLETPSPHGSATELFVEVVADDADPLAYDTAQRPWIRAQDGSYVVGFDKPRVMGTPILVYESGAKARDIAERLKADAASWEALRKREKRPKR